MDVDAVNSLSLLAKEKGHRVRVMGVFCAMEHIFNEAAMHARAQASSRLAKANRASHGPREPTVPKARTRVKHRKLVSQVLKKTSSETQESAQTCPTDSP